MASARASLGALMLLVGLAVQLPPPAFASVTDEVVDGANAFGASVCGQAGGPAGGAFTSYTDKSKNVAPGDVPLSMGTGATGVRDLFVGGNGRFGSVVFEVTSAGAANGRVAWSYSRGGGQWGTLIVDDQTDHFHQSGIRMVHLTVPNDWAKDTPDGVCAPNCPTAPCDLFYVKAVNTVLYTNHPVGGRVGIILYNLLLKVETDAHTPVEGLGAGHFELTQGANNAVMSLHALGTGRYELALGTGTDPSYDVAARPADYGPSSALSVGTVDGWQPVDFTSSPLVVRHPVKVTLSTTAGLAVNGADVRIGNRPADATAGNAYYFRGTTDGSLSVKATGFAAVDSKVDKALQKVQGSPGAAQTVLVLSGSTACGSATSLPAGGSATCRGLSLPKSTGPRTSSNGGETPPSDHVEDFNVGDDAEPGPIDAEDVDAMEGPATPLPSWVWAAAGAAGLALVVLAVGALRRKRPRMKP